MWFLPSFASLTPTSLCILFSASMAAVTSFAQLFPKFRNPVQTLCLRLMSRQSLYKFLRCVTGISKPASVRLNSLFVSATCNSSCTRDPVFHANPGCKPGCGLIHFSLLLIPSVFKSVVQIYFLNILRMPLILSHWSLEMHCFLLFLLQVKSSPTS